MTVGRIDVFPLPRGAVADQTGAVGGWWISSYFGTRADPFTGRASGHGGMDLPCPSGTPLYAVKAGTIYQAWDPSGGGNWTRLVCDDGDVFGYGHAKAFAPGPNGRHVQAGELIAYANSTGASTGSHLHFAYGPRGGAYADPFDLLKACRTFVGSPAPKPDEIPTEPKASTTTQQPAPPEEDIMATKAELDASVNAAADRVIAAIEAAKPAPADDGLWMGTFQAENKVYVVINGVRYHVPGGVSESDTNNRLALLQRQGFDNRGVQDAALSVLPEAPFSLTA